ncbi:hypothetical protein [Spongiimicrobium sp. 2-473A-2-J]|uniref:hypothetical protein n=1 Tax=Eudoraea algarum TaxID=3417568 RepID=UPI003D35C49B
MNRYLYLLFLTALLIFWSSCRKDFDFAPSTGTLQFSRDTVFLDTVFTNIGSSTYTLKVYNRSRDDLSIPSIRLGQGDASNYRLNVDGVAGKSFEDIPLLAKDSLFIFIETTFDIAPTNANEFLYTDVIQFDSGANQQEVPLVTLIRDAIFLFPGEGANGMTETLFLGLDEAGNEIRVEGFVLNDAQLGFTNEKPYVIYGYAAVADGKTLSMAAGTRVHFHQDSGILVRSGASLKVNGALSTDPELLENEVIFEGDRLEPSFSDVPGQWGTVWLRPGSLDHEVVHLTIKNATVGILAEGDGVLSAPTLSIRNTQIYNSASVNLWGRTAWINGENLVLGSAGNISLYGNEGGRYHFAHTTIGNYWVNSFRNGPALQLDNTMGTDLVGATFTSCIIDGNTSREILLAQDVGGSFVFNFTRCLLKFQDSGGQFANDPLYDFGNNALYTDLFLNGDTDFREPRSNDFRLAESSSALDNAEPATALQVPLDILGVDRTVLPDIGAYERIPEN